MTRRRDVGDRPLAWRRRLILAGWLGCSAMIGVRAGQVQVIDAAEWREIAAGQHRADEELAAARGGILDRDGDPLSVTRDRTRVHVAPREVRDVEATATLLSEVLRVSDGRALRLASNGRGWNAAGVFEPATRDRLRGAPGVYAERVFERFYPHDGLARGVIGTVVDGEGRGGIESHFEDWLSGTPGRAIVARDHLGNPIPGERVTVESPRAGGEIVLTLDMDLQEIAQAALLDAIEEREAQGGDVIITNPRTGEILALFSLRDGQASALSAVNTPYEPGSTIKPFTVAGLLKHRVASMNDTVDVGDGTWTVAGRTLHDTHGSGLMTVREALRESSNVGIAKAALGMTPGVQYENLRDFGFGSPTGVELPGEEAGTLRRPGQWSAQSAASLAVGYEISVTPLQMAMAYGALANGGLLMRPILIRELRDADGSVAESYEPKVVRRVIDQRTARSVGRALVDVVEGGTGTRARLGTFQVAGKSGTARYNDGSGYQRNEYQSSFVGYFPADDPQLVVFVKLDRPQGEYYGGAVAAPVTRATMEAALAAASIDLGGLVERAPSPSARAPSSVLRQASLEPPLPAIAPDPAAFPGGALGSVGDGRIALPDVSGLPARLAIRHLHRVGLRVARVGAGEIAYSSPPAGTRVSPGDTVGLTYRGGTHD